mgnify:CR=1 FL=1
MPCCSCLQVCLSVLASDNQANGLLAMRLFVDLSKHLVRNQVSVQCLYCTKHLLLVALSLRLSGCGWMNSLG